MRVESIIAPNGKLWSEMKKKTKKRKPIKARPSKRQAKKLAWRRARKMNLWYDDIIAGRYSRCGLCGGVIARYEDCELDHKRCLGTRGDGDTDENTHLTHKAGNRHKGSVSLDAYLEKYTPEERRALCQGLQ